MTHANDNDRYVTDEEFTAVLMCICYMKRCALKINECLKGLENYND